MSVTQTLIPTEIQVLTVCDCEGDIFDLFRLKRPDNSDLLIRSTHNRKVNHLTKYLHQAIRQTEARGQVTVEVRRNPEQIARSTNLTIRWATFEIQVPLHHIGRKQLEPVKLQVILAQEENPPSSISPIC